MHTIGVVRRPPCSVGHADMHADMPAMLWLAECGVLEGHAMAGEEAAEKAENVHLITAGVQGLPDQSS